MTLLIFSVPSLAIFSRLCVFQESFPRNEVFEYFGIISYPPQGPPLWLPAPPLWLPAALWRGPGTQDARAPGPPLPLSPPQGFNWTLFIQSVLSSVKIKLLPNEEVVVYGIPYLRKLEDIIDVFSAR